MYGEKNALQWGGDLAHYRKLAMHQQGKLKPITISDADLRRLSYVPREHALRKGSASLARFRTSYAPLFELCDDAVVADQFLLFLRRKLNDKIEKHAMKVGSLSLLLTTHHLGYGALASLLFYPPTSALPLGGLPPGGHRVLFCYSCRSLVLFCPFLSSTVCECKYSTSETHFGLL